ncbi:NBR1-Ig-like domain-containing protein [Sinosporangium siamense]|uniref:NBR1-Ig-like domain-containing protein n=1 Tax=Sinosporangium siamense TaxID=1367973 RepID=UPI00194E2E05|nr:NBR1-Ig-like domain-containing protein [Sinosporangium siamense]
MALRELRNSVGNPPFREMSGRSGAISHTTLHEATKGNRLPSWETTVEFVKACGADPSAYQERWERANRTVRSASAVGPSIRADSSVGTDTLLDRPRDEIVGDIQPLLPPQGSGGRFRLSRTAAIATAAVTIGAVVLVVAVVNRGSTADGSSLNPSAGSPSHVLSPVGCPVRLSNPSPAPPLYKGDRAVFITDVTLPDCTRVGTGTTMTKVWRLENAGTVPWKGYSLRRLDPTQHADQCQTKSNVPIKETQPGEMVDIRTDITTPNVPGLCYVRFKMVDASGTVVFPGSRPVNFQIIVDGR